MIVRSDIITRATIGAAVRDAGLSFIDTESREGWYEPIREFRPRRFTNGFEFFLSGSSKYNAQHGYKEKAATWDEWGIVIDRLYSVDPDARIGWYDNRADFFAKTRNEFIRVDTWHDPKSYYAQCHRAPWLNLQRLPLSTEVASRTPKDSPERYGLAC